MHTDLVPRIGTKRRMKMMAKQQHVISAYTGGIKLELSIHKDKAANKAIELSVEFKAAVGHYGDAHLTIYTDGEITHSEEITNIGEDDKL